MRPAAAFRAARSKQGAAMALVIVMTTAMLILVAALLAAANFNVDYTSRGVQGRQAYLSAKSAVEYARAYAAARKDDELGTLSPADTLYVIAKNGALTTDGFDVVKNAPPERLEGKAYASISLTPDTAAAAGTTSTEQYTLTIRGSAPQLDQKSAKSLGYRCTLTRTTVVTPPTPAEPSESGGNGFVLMGQMGGQVFFDQLFQQPVLSAENASSPYPLVVISNRLNIRYGQVRTVDVPQFYLLKGLNLEVSASLTTKTDFICLNENLTFQGSVNDTLAQWIINPKTEGSSTVLFVPEGSGLKIFKPSETLSVAPGYYEIAPGQDLGQITTNSGNALQKITDHQRLSELTKQNLVGEDGKGLQNAVSGDDWDLNHGTLWVKSGALSGSIATSWTPSWGGNQNSWVSGANPDGIKNKDVYCYVTDASHWGESSDMRQFRDATYMAHSMFWQYVCPDDWLFPAGKTITFQADTFTGTVTLNTQASEENSDERPAIVAGDKESHFIIKADQFIVPNDITVYWYKNNSLESYVMQAGVYTHNKFSNKGVDLFSSDGEHAALDGPDEPLPDYGGGSGGTGGDPGSIVTTVELTDGRYTDG